MDTLVVKERADLGVAHFELFGVMNEKSKFPSVLNVGNHITVNLDKVLKTNSPGLQLWIQWIRSFHPTQKINLIHVPDHFMMSASMVESLLTRSCQISSFYVPYVNINTNIQKKYLLTLGKDFKENLINVNKKFSDMEIDVSPERFFLCLKRINPGMVINIK